MATLVVEGPSPGARTARGRHAAARRWSGGPLDHAPTSPAGPPSEGREAHRASVPERYSAHTVREIQRPKHERRAKRTMPATTTRTKRERTVEPPRNDVPRNTVVHADALRVLADLPAGHVDLTVFSPPYDGIRDYGKNWTLDYQTLGSELFRAASDGGVRGGHRRRHEGFRQVAHDLPLGRGLGGPRGWRLFECCIYQRHGNPGAWWSQRFRVDHEYILIFFRVTARVSSTRRR